LFKYLCPYASLYPIAIEKDFFPVAIRASVVPIEKIEAIEKIEGIL